jgi:molybdopterin converting factor small subunit
MMIHFEFSSYFSEYLGEKVHSIELAQNEAALELVLDAFFKQYPAHESVFKQHFYREGKMFALFVCCGNILQPNSVLKDGDRVKVVTPVSGG